MPPRTLIMPNAPLPPLEPIPEAVHVEVPGELTRAQAAQMLHELQIALEDDRPTVKRLPDLQFVDDDRGRRA